MAKASADIKDIKAWFDEHRDYIIKNGVAGLIEGFTAQLDSLEVIAANVNDLETAVHSAYEFMSGEWEPDDVDRAKFTRELAELSGETDDDDDEEELCECGRRKSACRFDPTEAWSSHGDA